MCVCEREFGLAVAVVPVKYCSSSRLDALVINGGQRGRTGAKRVTRGLLPGAKLGWRGSGRVRSGDAAVTAAGDFREDEWMRPGVFIAGGANYCGAVSNGWCH